MKKSREEKLLWYCVETEAAGLPEADAERLIETYDALKRNKTAFKAVTDAVREYVANANLHKLNSPFSTD